MGNCHNGSAEEWIPSAAPDGNPHYEKLKADQKQMQEQVDKLEQQKQKLELLKTEHPEEIREKIEALYRKIEKLEEDEEKLALENKRLKNQVGHHRLGTGTAAAAGMFSDSSDEEKPEAGNK